MMKLNSIFINGIIIAVLLPFFFGCDNYGDPVYVYSKGIGIQYVDKEGNFLYFDKDGSISYLDKDDYFSQSEIINEEDILKTCPMEIISFTDESGIPLKYQFSYNVDHFGLGIIENEERKDEYSYIIQYKIPLISGESVQEIRVTLKETKYGIPDGWHNCQYNGNTIRCITSEEIFPHYHDPQYVIDEEEHYRRWIEMMYSGDLVAHCADGSIFIVIPVDIAP